MLYKCNRFLIFAAHAVSASYMYYTVDDIQMGNTSSSWINATGFYIKLMPAHVGCHDLQSVTDNRGR